VKNISKSFGKNKVLNKISFNVEKGDIISVIGPSGSGKSTLLRCINHLEVPNSGKIIFNGEEVTKKNITKVREKIGMVFQQFNLFPNMTVLENLCLAPVTLKKLSKDEAKIKAIDLLGDIHLLDKKDAYPDSLSGGQKQRVAIARTLMMEPDIILFDEPTSALDPEMVNEVLNMISELAGSGITMIIVSHEMNFIKKCANRVLFLEKGKIEFDGTVQDAFGKKENKRLNDFLSSIMH
ncbi:MAG: amino acid ABC transporter ATP-binding protein, partial [bacterium]|nr:amino acid ABC transporter ATP-binding protein [bacterium]